jgi:3-methyladenine DNA glycosylase/8-oxoguanine DNA glycosylase
MPASSTVHELYFTHTSERILHPCPPFHFDGTVYKPSYFPGPDLEFASGHLWHTMRFAGSLYGIRMDNLGTVAEPALRLVVFSEQPIEKGAVDRVAAEMSWRYDLAADLSSFYDQFQEDDLLAPVLARWRGVRPSTYSSLYEYLVISTLLQNATVRRTVQMAGNLFDRFGSWITYDGKRLAAYWEPEAIDQAADEELRALKVGYRAKTLKRQAAAFLHDGLDEQDLRKLPTPELKKQLLKIYGVGPASVWYLLFGQFKCYEVFDTISPWEQKIYSRLLFQEELVDSRLILAEVDRRWGRWKMLASHLIFEDLFWQRRSQPVPWLEELIRL